MSDDTQQEPSRRARLDGLLVELLATGRRYAEAGALANVSARTCDAEWPIRRSPPRARGLPCPAVGFSK